MLWRRLEANCFGIPQGLPKSTHFCHGQITLARLLGETFAALDDGSVSKAEAA